MNFDIDGFLRDIGARGIDPNDFYKALGTKLKSSSFADGFCARGRLLIYKQFDNGERHLVSDRWNTVMNKGFQILALMWSGDPGSPTILDDIRPYYIAIGDPTAPTDPATNKNAITLDKPVLKRTFDQITFLGAPNVNGVQFEMIVPKSIGNGRNYSEAGLFPFDFEGSSATPPTGGMIARQIYTAIPKNSSFQLAYNWRFTFTQA